MLTKEFYKPTPKNPVPSTTAVYKPGIGITITRANIALLKQECAEEKRTMPEPAELVHLFASTAEQHSKTFKDSKTYVRRVVRATQIITGRVPKVEDVLKKKKNPVGKEARKRKSKDVIPQRDGSWLEQSAEIAAELS